MKQKFTSALKLLLFIGVGILLIWLVAKDLTEEDIENIKSSFRKANYLWITFSMFLGVLSHISRALRWRMLLKPIGYKTGAVNTFLAVMIGYFANFAFPRLGEVMRCGVLKNYEKVPLNASLGTVITERLLDLIILLVLVFFTLVTQFALLKDYFFSRIFDPLSIKLQNAFPGTSGLILYIGVAVVFIGLALFIRHKFKDSMIMARVTQLLSGFWNGLKSIKDLNNPWGFIGHTILIWTLYYMMVYVVFNALPELAGMSVGAGFAVLVFGSFAIAAVPGGIGAYPLFVAETLTLYGVLHIQGYAFGWIIWTAQAIMLFIFGMLSLALLPILNNRSKIEDAVPEG